MNINRTKEEVIKAAKKMISEKGSHQMILRMNLMKI